MATIKSIKEKAKAYDSNYKVYTELINRLEDVKDAIKKQNYGIAMNVLCKHYPDFQVTTHSELKESEDEQHRKWILEYLYDSLRKSDEQFKDHFKAAISWLEKQGNLMKALQISNAKIGELIEKNYYLREQLEKQGEQSHTNKIEPKFRVGDTIKCKYDNRQFTIKSVDLDKGIYTYTQEGCGNDIDYADEDFELVEQKPTVEMKTPEESLGIDSDTYNKIVDECVYGEQKPIKEHNACEFCEDRYGCVNPCSMKLIEEEKFTYKVKPKFEIGDLITNGILIGKIDEIHEFGYHAYFGDHYADVPNAEYWHKWTIQDAKDGDVLAVTMYPEGTWIGILKEYNGCTFSSYCFVNTEGTFKLGTYNHGNGKAIHPATKEQRNLLFQKMHEAGYEWNAELKQLKKIEQNPAWSEKDIELLDNTIKFIEDRVAATSPSLRTYNPTLTGKEIPFLKALKDRAQPKQEWSEKDEKVIDDAESWLDMLCSYLKNNSSQYIPVVKEVISKLKSLRPQSQWKPSDEQMITLRHVISGCSYDIEPLVELETKLKEL